MCHVTSLSISSVWIANRPALVHHSVVVLAAVTKFPTLMEMPYLADARYSTGISPGNDLAAMQKWDPVDRYIDNNVTITMTS